VEAPVTVATKSTDFRQELGVPVGVAHEVVTSERYLFTLDGSETDPGTMVVSEQEIDRRDDGSVYARAVAGKADPEAETPPMVMEQVSEISAPGDDGAFTMDSTVPLPKSMGTMRTLQRFGPADDGGTLVVTTVTAEVDLPLVGGKIAKQLVSGSEESTARTLRRIEVLAGDGGSDSTDGGGDSVEAGRD
jgi:hypothetical protein